MKESDPDPQPYLIELSVIKVSNLFNIMIMHVVFIVILMSCSILYEKIFNKLYLNLIFFLNFKKPFLVNRGVAREPVSRYSLRRKHL